MHIVTNISDILGFRLAQRMYRARYRSGDISTRPLLVNGSPKTGTTWMLMMLASVPPYRHGPNFNGRIERYSLAPAGVVYHGHDPYSKELDDIIRQRDIGVVVTMRDPRDQAVSRMFHLRREKRHPYHESFKDLDDDAALMAAIEGRDGGKYPGVMGMVRLTESWMGPDSPAMVVKYEDLLSDSVGWMMSVCRHLKIPMDEQFLKALVRYFRFERVTVGRGIWKRRRRQGEEDSRSHFRKGISGDWKNYFKPEHVVRFKEIAGETLVQWGYEPDLDW